MKNLKPFNNIGARLLLTAVFLLSLLAGITSPATAAHTITISAMNSDGSLASIGSVSVPAGVVGLAAH